MSRISSIAFNKHEQPKRATIRTPHGTVKVKWLDVRDDWIWFIAGPLEAQKLAVPVIQRIERMTAKD